LDFGPEIQTSESARLPERARRDIVTLAHAPIHGGDRPPGIRKNPVNNNLFCGM
jgi:hypothetical protein